MILTNRFQVNYDMKAIDRDFDIFMVEKQSEKLDKTNILDIAGEQFQARAVQYSFGRRAYVLFDKNSVSQQEYQKALMDEHTDVKVSKVDLMDEEKCEELFFYKKRLLLQLLCNSIRVPKLKAFSYHNLTGKLFYLIPEWISVDKKIKKPYALHLLEIGFDPGMYLNLHVKTFRKNIHSKSGRYYIFDPVNGCFRRKLHTDSVPMDEWFTEKSFDKSKNRVDYLDFSSIDAFKTCKLGVMTQFLTDVEKYLGKYVELEQVRRDNDRVYEEHSKVKKGRTFDVLVSMLIERGINITDRCETEASQQLVRRLVEELEGFYHITPKLGRPKREIYNIILVHSKEYYEENNHPDPYKKTANGVITQHLVLEEHENLRKPVGAKKSPVIYKILQELVLKGEVRTGEVRLFDWNALSTGKTWTFVQRHRINKEEHGKRTDHRFIYHCVTIDQSGKMEFKTFYDLEWTQDEIEERIRSVYDEYYLKGKNVEGIVFSDVENIHVILRTNEKTMPNLRPIWNALKETDSNDAVRTAVVAEAVKQFCGEHPEHEEYGVQLLADLETLPDVIKKGELRKHIHVRSTAGKLFNRYFREVFGIWVCNELKNRDFKEEFLLESVTDIRYYEDDNTDGQGIHSFNYYASIPKSALNTSLCNAAVVRQVRAEEEIEFQELLPLMAVDFVRAAMATTVLPFSFKYLREYHDIITS